MFEFLKAKLLGKSQGRVTESSSLADIAALYPNLFDFLQRRYGVRAEAADRRLTLGEVVKRNALPPAQVVFMEMQLEARSAQVPTLPARDVQASQWKILDVREPWEYQFGALPNAEPLNPQCWDEIVTSWEKDTPILLYCHFGVRSLDAASQLMDLGFTNVRVLQGGIDAWSQDVDPTVARYEGSWC
jgi:rhodanese-related sulfurtransferase